MLHMRLNAKLYIVPHLRAREKVMRAMECMGEIFMAALTGFHIFGVSPRTVIRFKCTMRRT